MKHILAQIDDLAAKAIYQTIAFYGTATFQDLIAAGYKRTTTYDAIALLENAGFIERPGKGVYRVSTSGTRHSTSGTQHFAERPVHGTQRPVRSTLSGTPDVDENAERPVHGTQRPVHGTESPVHQTLGVENVNMLTTLLTNKQTNPPTIKSTKELETLFYERYQKIPEFLAKCRAVTDLFRESKIHDVCADLIVRVVATEYVFDKGITADHLQDWISEAQYAVRSQKVKEAYIALAKNIKNFYQQHSVKWTKCRPDPVRKLYKEFRDAKPKPLETLMIQYPDGSSEPASNLLSEVPPMSQNHQPLESLQNDVYEPKSKSRKRSDEYRKAQDWVEKLPPKDQRPIITNSRHHHANPLLLLYVSVHRATMFCRKMLLRR